jgi:hypothetical protein
MTAATLPRITAAPDTLDELDSELAQRALRELHYSAMAVEKARTTATALAYHKLLGAGIQPFQNTAVEKYMRWMIVVRWGKTVGLQLAIIVTAYALLRTIVAIIGSDTPISTLSGIGVVAIGIAIVITSVVTWTTLAPISWEWHSVPLSRYSSPIPTPIIALVLQVKSLLPASTLWIHEFRRSSHIIDPDPFLYITLDNSSEPIYIAAWDEPTFRSTEGRK